MPRYLKAEEENQISNLLDNAEVVGDGPVIKDAFYRIFRLEEKHYAVLLTSVDFWTCAIEEIEDYEVENYI